MGLISSGQAQTTESKIQLMSEALRAKDVGDFATARARLLELSQAAPNDPAVARLIAEVERKLAERLVVNVALPVSPVFDEEAEAVARAETDRLRALLDHCVAQRKLAKTLAKERRYEEAIGVLDAALQELPRNPLTQKIMDEVWAEQAELRLEQARHLLKSGDLVGARFALGARQGMGFPSEAVDRFEEALTQGEARADAAAKSVRTSPPVVTVSTDAAQVDELLNKARHQYLAGASDDALATYRGVEARDLGNEEAKRFITRITREIESKGGGMRQATRSELLAEVDQSWQRPGVYEEQTREARNETNVAPLRRKLEEIVLPTVSFTRVEIGRVLSALGSASGEFDDTQGAQRGVNIVLLDPSNANPTVTLSLRNTSLKRVLDFVTQSVGYQYEVQADAVVVRPGGEATTLDTAFFPVSRATVLRMTGAGGGTSNAPPSNPFSSVSVGNGQGGGGNEAPGMQAFLQQAGVNFEATPGSSLAYDGSSIIVTQTSRNLERIRNILNRYNDIRQVEIEAKFMEVQEGALEELGVNWTVGTKPRQRVGGTVGDYQSSGRGLAEAFNTNTASQQGSITRPGSTTLDGVVTETINTTPIINNPPQIPGTAYLGAAANAIGKIAGVIGEFNVNAVVRALSQKQGTDLLSAPKITVLSGNTATITVAQEMRYPQSFGQTQSQVGTGSASGGGSAGVAITAGTPQEFTTRNVGVELKVTPTVEEDDYSISLDLNPRVTEFDGFVEYGGPSVAISGNTTVNVPSGFYQPIFSVRDISTKVTIWDGATLIMGGLTREEVKKVNDKIPVLGDIPLLGRMFRSKGETTQKRNLLIFVTANLLSPGGLPKKQTLQRVAPNSMFQNPVIVTPGGSEPRTDN